MDKTAQQVCSLTIVGGTRDRNKFSWLAEQLRAGVFGNALVAITGSVPDAWISSFPRFRVTVLTQGCACCGGQAGLIASLRDILRKRQTHLEPFDRIVLEVVDADDIEDIAASVEADAILSRLTRVSEVVVALAGTEGSKLFEDQSLLARQVELADCVIVTGSEHPQSDFERAVGSLKPGIPIYGVQDA